jgi:hypothetical protein
MSDAPKPLSRLSGYKIALEAGTRPPPPRPMPGDTVSAFYRSILGSLSALIDEQDEARTVGDYERKYRLKIGIKATEEVAVLLHELVDGQAVFVCDRACAHLARGLDVNGCKAFVDALDVAVEELQARNAQNEPSHVTYDDQLAMIAVYGGWRDRFLALLPS